MSKVKHIVLLKFIAGASDEQIGGFFDQVLDISESAAGVEDYVSGANCSPENQNQGMTHGFVMTFADGTVRDGYLNGPDHQRFKTLAEPLIESTVVFDFEI